MGRHLMSVSRLEHLGTDKTLNIQQCNYKHTLQHQIGQLDFPLLDLFQDRAFSDMQTYSLSHIALTKTVSMIIDVCWK